MAHKETLYSLYDIAFDLIARIIPALGFMWLAWRMLLDRSLADDIWMNGVRAHWTCWVGILLFAYLIGQMMDSLTWKLTDFFAKAAYEDDVSCSESWNDLMRWYLKTPKSAQDEVEFANVTKAHAEGRGLVNWAVFLVIAALVLLLLALKGRNLDLWPLRNEAPQHFPLLLTACLAGAAAAFWGGYARERRRVKGMLALRHAADEADKKQF